MPCSTSVHGPGARVNEVEVVMVTCYDVYDFLGAHCPTGTDESECSLAQTWPDDVSVPTHCQLRCLP